MTKDEALVFDLALEALEKLTDTEQTYEALDLGDKAITAIKQARALDKMADNARELGLDYEPADGTQVSKVWWDGEKLMAKPIPLEDFYQPVQPVALGQEPVFELQESGWEIICDLDWIQTLPFGTKLYTTPPAAQRPFVGLTDEERTEIRREHYARTLPLMDAVEAKLKEKNT
jgi:hypothetical protein